jgi:hypothetical protein
MTVDSGYADWLKKGALFINAAPASAALWPDRGKATEITTPFNARADAIDESVRQLAFLAGPNVKDKILVMGARKDLIGKSITAKGDRLGYNGAGKVVFVLGVEELDNGTTVLTVVRPLP